MHLRASGIDILCSIKIKTEGADAQVERNLLQNKENLFEAHASLSGSLHGAFSGEGSQDARESPREQHGKENGVH